ncbi:MAG TPA: hypothetical protein VGO11_06935 [Chthoniobacteraceae bacterium]|jgi:hypothetical protein|nr:hypothetical protein [Chthoniobacteraceae bacterium]
MAFRIGDLVLAGVFCHSSPYAVHGHLVLRGSEDPYMFELMGTPASDLCGRSFEFSVPANDREPSDEDRRLAAAFAAQQVGSTGEMTAARRVKTYDCPPEDIPRLLELKQLPPPTLRQCLYLEWFSQNGRVVLEVVDPQIVPLDETQETPSPLEESDDAPTGLDPASDFPEFEIEEVSEEEPPDYSATSRELDQELEEAARRVDREISGQSDEADEFLREMETFDELLEHGPRIPLRSLLKDLSLPEPAPEMPEAQAMESLKAALARLAMTSVAFHICKHCSIQEAYRIFMQEVCNEGAIPGMPGSFVQHFTTSDFCPKCMEE